MNDRVEGAARADSTIEIAQVIEAALPPGARWSPAAGPETLALREHLRLDDVSANRVEREAVGVLSRCLPPGNEPERVTGLVVGYVQSGKTLSFTTVAALARDCDYQLVIVITGISTTLLDQSSRRLERDLRLLTRSDRRWLHFESDTTQGFDKRKIRSILENWRDPEVPPSARRTVLITVMKHHGHLKGLTDALTGVDLTGINALIIDDEADQASLNAYVRRRSGSQESRTYERILALRDVLPRHSFLQYTATPQAPLLITIIDVLSPGFVEILTPGDEYVGGKDFFRDGPPLVRVIPDSEIPSAGNTLLEPSASLLEALQLFFLGVAAGIVRRELGPANRSMMVHPSQDRLGHSDYHEWVSQICEQWKRVLDPAGSLVAERTELLADFDRAYQSLRDTVGAELPEFAELQRLLRFAIRDTHIEKLNAASGVTPTINWSSNYSFILVGGQAMDRGFTVEGLTVTYMPRGIGVGNADTVQQRARFFGYKRSYLGYCRVYLESDACDAYKDYVIHEEHMRRSLAEHRRSGRPLTEWKRAFFLDATLKPTRRSVLKLDYMRDTLGSGWTDVASPHVSREAIRENRALVAGFLSGLELREDVGHPSRTESMKHSVAIGVSLRRVLDDLLTRFQAVAADDSQRFTGVRLVIEDHLDRHPDATCNVYSMSQGRARERSIDKGGDIKNLFQGSSPVRRRPDQDEVYPGDRKIGAGDEVSVQIHNLRVKDSAGAVIDEEVPTLAVWLPVSMAQDVVIQDQTIP